MKHSGFIHSSASAFALFLALHAGVYPAFAETENRLKDAAAQANDTIFKPQTRDLYRQSDDQIELLGVTPLSEDARRFSPSELFYGVSGQTADQGALPEIDQYEDLFPHRDNALNNLEAGAGVFGRTGAVNAEANAMSVLSGSENTPSVRVQQFLFPSRDIKQGNGVDLAGEFADCVQVEDVETTTVVSDATYLEHCETRAINDSAMQAHRAYQGPTDAFVYSVEKGVGYCSDGTTTTRVEDARTCASLSALDRIPEAFEIRNCEDGTTSCVEILLTSDEQMGYGAMPWLWDYDSIYDFCNDFGMPDFFYEGFTWDLPRVSNLCYNAAFYFEDGFAFNGYHERITHFPAGQNYDSPNTFPLEPSIGTPFERGLPKIGIPEMNRIGSGPYNSIALDPNADPNDMYKYLGDSAEYFNDDGLALPLFSPNTPEILLTKFLQPNLTLVYHKSAGQNIIVNRQEFLRALTSYPPPEPCDYNPFFTGNIGSQTALYLCQNNSSFKDILGHGLGPYSDTMFGDIDITSRFAIRTGVVVADAGYAVEGLNFPGSLTLNSTTLTSQNVGAWQPLPSMVNHGGQLQTLTFSYDLSNGVTEHAISRIRLAFSEDLFSPWTYLSSRWAEISALVDSTSCTLEYSVLETAADASGCVRSLSSGNASAGHLCGTEIPLPSPFDGLTDRAATRISVRPSCPMPELDEGDQNISATDDNCTEFRNDPMCSFVSHICIDDEEELGFCHTYENTYRCGTSSSYETPVVTTRNICTGNVSCLGDDCLPNTGTDATIDLADTAAKLSAVDMIVSEMDCGSDGPPSSGSLGSCRLFEGDSNWCARTALGTSNCCKNPKGVSLYDYLTLAFAVSRLNSTLTSMGHTNAITSAWTSLGDMGRGAYTELTRPLVEIWEGIVGSSSAGAGAAAGSFSMEAVKQSMMKSVASWTEATFGQQAAGSIFQTVNGTVGFTAAAQSVMQAVSVAFTVYAVVDLVAGIVLACRDNELELGVKRAIRATHEVGTYCSRRVLGACLSRRTTYCQFSSPFARIMNEQIRKLKGKGYGSAEHPDCSGISLSQLESIDMQQLDLSEWTGMMLETGLLDLSRITNIDAMTGQSSTLGRAISDLYTREDAITRNTNRFDDVDTDFNRQDALDDFGRMTITE